jgi:predicted ATP-grasp superfamily ATP-dependent carboligase
MRLFAYEFVTGGGMLGQPLPRRLVREADLMLRSLLQDLADIPQVRVVTSRDARLAPLQGFDQIAVAAGEDPLVSFDRGVAVADAVWPVAPESDGVLERLARRSRDQRKPVLGCAPDAIRLSASKAATAAMLGEHGIPVVPTYLRADDIPSQPGCWIIKPDDGAGSESVQCLADWSQAGRALAVEPGRLVAQPWVEGEPRSLSLICADGEAQLLAVNRQHVRKADDTVSLAALTVNAVADGFGEFADLGCRVAAAIPGLWGYVGVDFIQTAEGPVVLEVNPRLTTSYCGLRTALGVNVAALVLALGHSTAPRRWQSRHRGRPVEITLEGA